jgi:predicted Zn-dependent peptidase
MAIAICRTTASAPTFAAGIAFPAGARYEQPREQGAAHLLEHLVFRGGGPLPSADAVTGAAEALGAEIAGFTSQELTSFFIRARAEEAVPATELLVAVLRDARLSEDDVDVERPVIEQEIAREADQIWMVAERLGQRAIFGDHRLGTSVLGESSPAAGHEVLARVNAEAVRTYRERTWADGVLVVAGNLRHAPDAERLAELAGSIPSFADHAPAMQPPAFAAGHHVAVREEGQQAQVRVGWWLGGDLRVPRRRAALAVVSAVLGGSMGSVLSSELRTRLGLCYTIYTNTRIGADYAYLQVSSGLDQGHCREAVERIVDLVEGVRARGLSAGQLERGRRFAASQVAFSLEGAADVLHHAIWQRLVTGANPSPVAEIAAIASVQPGDVVDILDSLSERRALAVVGPSDTDWPRFSVGG